MKLRWLVPAAVVIMLLVAALMITAARLLEPPGGRWVRLVAFTPHAVVLYALALLVLLVAVLAARGTWRRVSAWLCVLVVPLLALHLAWASDAYVGGPEAAAGTGEQLTVMSANLLRGRADPDVVVEEVVERDIDVVVLLEVTPDGRSALGRAGLRETLPHVTGQPGPGVTGTMVFSAHRLSAVTELDTALDAFSTRVQHPAGRFDLLAVHPHFPTGDAAEWRADHTAIRRAAVAAREPVVIAGDLNATTDHVPMRELAGRGFEDAAEAANSGWQPTWPASGEVSLLGVEVPPMLRIDHVLVDDGFGVVGTEAVDIPGTDHRAVVATLAWQ